MQDVIVDVPIAFDVEGGTRVHSPMVHAAVGGVPTRLILDTGSTDHVLTKELIDRVGAPTQRAEDGTDHAGAAVPSWSVGDLAIDIGTRTFDLHEVVAIAAPGPFEAWGVGGFLSPQHLHPTARVLLDLAGDRLVVMDPAGRDRQAVDAALAARVPALRPVEVHRDPAFVTVVIAAAIEPYAPVATMLNSGGRGTEFARRVMPDVAGPARDDPGKGVSGAAVDAVEAGARIVTVGPARIPVGRLFVRDEMDEPPGLIGMNVLRGTALIFGADPVGARDVARSRGVARGLTKNRSADTDAIPCDASPAGRRQGIKGGRGPARARRTRKGGRSRRLRRARPCGRRAAGPRRPPDPPGPELARDAVQDALFRAWRDLPGLRDPDRFDAWLHRLTLNACFDQTRRRRRRPMEVELEPIHAPAVADPSSDLADRDQVDTVLRRLDEHGRAIVVLHYYLGMPLTEVAATLAIPTGTVKSRLHRALEDMRFAMVMSRSAMPHPR